MASNNISDKWGINFASMLQLRLLLHQLTVYLVAYNANGQWTCLFWLVSNGKRVSRREITIRERHLQAYSGADCPGGAAERSAPHVRWHTTNQRVIALINKTFNWALFAPLLSGLCSGICFASLWISIKSCRLWILAIPGYPFVGVLIYFKEKHLFISVSSHTSLWLQNHVMGVWCDIHQHPLTCTNFPNMRCGTDWGGRFWKVLNGVILEEAARRQGPKMQLPVKLASFESSRFLATFQRHRNTFFQIMFY